MQKFYVHLASKDSLKELQTNPHALGSYITVSENDGVHIAIIESRHRGLRFDIDQSKGVTVLPGPHCPEPIGDKVAALFPHIKAQPHETMRSITLRLCDKHGPSFHPDT